MLVKRSAASVKQGQREVAFDSVEEGHMVIDMATQSGKLLISS